MVWYIINLSKICMGIDAAAAAAAAAAAFAAAGTGLAAWYTGRDGDLASDSKTIHIRPVAQS